MAAVLEALILLHLAYSAYRQYLEGVVNAFLAIPVILPLSPSAWFEVFQSLGLVQWVCLLCLDQAKAGLVGDLNSFSSDITKILTIAFKIATSDCIFESCWRSSSFALDRANSKGLFLALSLANSTAVVSTLRCSSSYSLSMKLGVSRYCLLEDRCETLDIQSVPIHERMLNTYPSEPSSGQDLFCVSSCFTVEELG